MKWFVRGFFFVFTALTAACATDPGAGGGPIGGSESCEAAMYEYMEMCGVFCDPDAVCGSWATQLCGSELPPACPSRSVVTVCMDAAETCEEATACYSSDECCRALKAEGRSCGY
jgi:hypothetical protein